MKIEKIKYQYVEIRLNEKSFYTFSMKIKHLIQLTYVAVRGRDKEKGAVQRVLNTKRISEIRDYVLKGNMFINTFVINWTDTIAVPTVQSEFLEIPILNTVAQLIDGQHRLEGIKEAVKHDENIKEKSVLVTMAIGMDTKDAANIFININSEQKPVPKSLIYDLYGITEENKDFGIARADDIAAALNSDITSPYFNLIKYPGNTRGRGKIDLSTVVSTLKKCVDVDGKFPRNNIFELNRQFSIIKNYFSALKYHWDKDNLWENASQNVFFKASGFVAAMDFFFENIFQKCIDNKNFQETFIISLFDFSETELITNDIIKNSDGKSARKMIMDNLMQGMKFDIPDESDYKI